jgi:hypothetical protein
MHRSCVTWHHAFIGFPASRQLIPYCRISIGAGYRADVVPPRGQRIALSQRPVEYFMRTASNVIERHLSTGVLGPEACRTVSSPRKRGAAFADVKKHRHNESHSSCSIVTD